MKLKTMLLLSGAAFLSIFTLTSCDDKNTIISSTTELIMEELNANPKANITVNDIESSTAHLHFSIDRSNFVIDSSANRTIDDEIDWQIVYLRQYYYDDERTTKVPPGEVIARFRELYNSFMTSHPDYYLSDYNVVIYFNIPLKQKNDMPPFRESGFLTTYDFESWNNKYTQLTGVSLDDDLWPYMYGRSGIETAAMTDNSYDQIIEVADNIPQLKKIIVHDQQMVDRVSDMRPNVNFVSAAE